MECAKALLEGKADPNLSDPDRVSPLVLALLNQHFDFAKYFIAAGLPLGLEIDRWDLYGRTPLYAAIDLSTLPTGGRPDTPSGDKTSANEVIALLLNSGANPNIQLKLRPPYRNVPFDRGGDQALSTGATPLLRAAKAGDNPVAMKLLIAHHALIDLANSEGITPLMIAAGVGHGTNPSRARYQTDDDAVIAVKMLLDAGADLQRKAANQQTALHGAAFKGWTNTVRLLGENGADLQAQDKDGKTALDYASANYKPIPAGGGLVVPPNPFPETVAVLQELLAKSLKK